MSDAIAPGTFDGHRMLLQTTPQILRGLAKGGSAPLFMARVYELDWPV
jgi:hypothetical protein